MLSRLAFYLSLEKKSPLLASKNSKQLAFSAAAGWRARVAGELFPDWRRGRDSNPRGDFHPPNDLANRPLQPLGYLSKLRGSLLPLNALSAKPTLKGKQCCSPTLYQGSPQNLFCGVKERQYKAPLNSRHLIVRIASGANIRRCVAEGVG